MLFANFLLAPVAFSAVALAGPIARQPSARTATQALLPLVSPDGLSYFVNLTVGGQPFSLQVDTAESDSWLLGAPDGFDQQVNATLDDGTTGEVFLSSFNLGGVTVVNQVYVQADSNANDTFPGVLGLGFTDDSEILSEMEGADINTNGTFSFVENLANQTSASFVSLYLPRSNATAGSLGLGTVPSNMSQILKQPRLPSTDGLWRVDLAADAVLVNGQNISLPGSILQHGGNLVASFESGTSVSYVNQTIASEIYGLLPTAVYDEDSNAWRVPCDSEVNVTIRFPGFDVVVHPLDAVLDAGFNDSTCLGSFQPFDVDEPDADLVLGTPFLHNAYLLLAPSGFVANGTDGPYVQLLPLTNASQAHEEFVAARSAPAQTPSADSSNSTGTFNFGSAPIVPSNAGSPTSAPSLTLAVATMLFIAFFSL